ncbi:MAG: plasmid pRiA4b ORF-3 family protein [Bacteroidia bacterium]|nr:plasmid pRiA4b ORF-3 family protein [Bacteroidia bacterium]
MAIYRFKVWFEEFDDVQRIIEIKSTQTFEQLHLAIQDAIGFDKSQLASFYISDDHWKKGEEITLESMGDDEEDPAATMKDCRLCDMINDPHQKFIYVFDFLEMWTFFVELTGIETKENPKVKYPVCVKSMGTAPKQYDKTAKFGTVDDNEFDEITKNYLVKSDEVPGEISDGEDDEQGGADEEDEFGSEEFGVDEDDTRY